MKKQSKPIQMLSHFFHSDRGFQYTSKVFKRKLIEQEMEQSMSRVGHCIDNGPTEGFWGIIKAEMYQMYEITEEASLRHAINDYIRFIQQNDHKIDIIVKHLWK